MQKSLYYYNVQFILFLFRPDTRHVIMAMHGRAWTISNGDVKIIDLRRIGGYGLINGVCHVSEQRDCVEKDIN